MVYILRTITNIQVGDLYPVQADTRKDAMLSRIRYIRNEATQIADGKLSVDQFKQYWDDIGQVKTYFLPKRCFSSVVLTIVVTSHLVQSFSYFFL